MIYISHNFLVSALSFVLAFMISASRVTSGVHRPIEVVIGGVLGATITFILFKVFL